MSQPAERKSSHVTKKRISVSKKRQITIPIEFFNTLGIDKEVECILYNNTIIIRPAHEGVGEFDEEILADLISQGLSGEELLSEFKRIRREIRPAVENLLAEAQLVAEGKGKFSTYRDVFETDDD